jgi:hypothetical protein
VLPEHPVTVAFGQTRRVCWDCTISLGGLRYSVPYPHLDERVWVRLAGDELVVTVIDPDGLREIARHPRRQRGRPQIRGEHYPPSIPAAERCLATRPPKARRPCRRGVPRDRERRQGVAG